jgi:hypothetical protein
MRLTEIPDLLANLCKAQARRRAAFFWLLFFAVQRKVTRATRETLLLCTEESCEEHPFRLRHLPLQAREGLLRRHQEDLLVMPFQNETSAACFDHNTD